jgi:hypothetical protein
LQTIHGGTLAVWHRQIVSFSAIPQCYFDYLSLDLEILQFIPSTRRKHSTPPRCCSDGLKPAAAESSTLERNFIMNKTTIATIAFTLATAFAGHAMAQETAAVTKTSEKPAATAKATESKSSNTADAFEALDKIKKW